MRQFAAGHPRPDGARSRYGSSNLDGCLSDRSDKRFAKAVAAQRAGNITDAARGYRRVLADAPRHAGALHMLGGIELRSGRFDEAAALIRRSLAVAPDSAHAHSDLGVALAAAGRHEAAVASFREAIAINGTFGPAFLNLAASLLTIGTPEAALDAARRAARLLPQLAAPHSIAAAALGRLNRPGEAQAAQAAALARNGTHSESLRGLAELRRAGGRDVAGTAELLERVASADTGPGTLIELAGLHRDAGDTAAAAAVMRRAEVRHGDDPLVRLAAAMAPLAPLYADEASRERAVAHYAEALAAFDGWARAAVPGRLAAVAEVLGRVQPFFLPYATDDVRELQRIYGCLAADATAARYGDAPLRTPPPREGERIRLGIISAHVRDHSVWKVPLRGWLAGLDRSRFAVTLYHVGEAADAVTAEARALACVFHHGSRSTAAWRTLILADRPHALIHAETGMNGAAFRLAAMRLAPLQCAGPGHPVTTGLPTMDLFLSSDAMEPAGGSAHYTERLVRLPGLGFAWRPPASAVSRAEPPPLPAGTRFFCGQSPFKYRPEDDGLLVAIARVVPDARFILVTGAGEAGLGDRLSDRLGRAFAAAGLDWPTHGHHVGRVTPSVFAGLAGACDVVLDNPSWSGCNSTLEGIVGATPVVTLPGRTMRSRHTAAILRRIGVGDGVADDRDDYIARAAALGLDPARRAAVRGRLRAAGLAALDDADTVRALEAAIQAGIALMSGGGTIQLDRLDATNPFT